MSGLSESIYCSFSGNSDALWPLKAMETLPDQERASWQGACLGFTRFQLAALSR